MATFEELVTIMREDYLNDTFDGIDTATPEEIDQNVLWSTNKLFRYLVQAQEEACLRGNLIYDESFTIDLVDGVSTYTLNPLFTFIRNVYYRDKSVNHVSADSMDYRFPDRFSKVGIGNNTASYFMNGYNLNVYPKPDASDIATAPQMVIQGYRLPLSDVLISDDLEIPINMHKNVIWYALYMAYSMHDADGADKKAVMYLNMFDQSFGPKLDHREIMHRLDSPKSNGYIGPINYLHGTQLNKDRVW